MTVVAVVCQMFQHDTRQRRHTPDTLHSTGTHTSWHLQHTRHTHTPQLVQFKWRSAGHCRHRLSSGCCPPHQILTRCLYLLIYRLKLNQTFV